jgi:tetratricopeptide (TPR) repeat protein
MLLRHLARPALFAGIFAALAPAARAAVPPHLILQNGRAVPVSAIALQGGQFVVKTTTPEFAANTAIPMAQADYISGDKPAEINQAIALLLTGQPREAAKLLDPLLAEHQCTNKLPGNFWLEAARAAAVAHALDANPKVAGDLVKAISEATPAQGTDPYYNLVRELSQPGSAKLQDRLDAFNVIAKDNLPADLCAYAAFFRAELLREHKRDAEALEGYLTVSCLFPSGGLTINGTARFRAAELLVTMKRRDEALALATSSLRCIRGTAVEAPLKKLMDSIQ